MKHVLSLIVLAGFLSASTASTAYAQFAIGARIGANISDYSLNTTTTNTTASGATGILGGLQVDYWFNSSWAFSGQLLYIQKGSTITSIATDQSKTVTDKISSNYLEIPLTVKLRVGDDVVRGYFFAGPTVGFLLSATANSSLSGGASTSNNVKDQFTSTDFGIIGGAGLDFVLSPSMTIFAEGGYRFGFANIDASSNASDTFNTENTRDIRFSAGIVWAISQ